MLTLNIWLPVLAMVALTVVVWLRMYRERIGEMRRRGIQPHQVATSQKAAGVLEQVQAADNFRNLFELPVLFYVLCLALQATGLVTPVFVVGAWIYVLLRVAHSFIHCTYNRVMHRFWVYAASSIVLFLLWLSFGVAILSR